MTRCQHCNKLTHCEDLYVTFERKDFDKIVELQSLPDWSAAYLLSPIYASEYGKLKCGDIYIHFICKKDETE